MRNKCILIILDGLSREVALEQLGYMNHLVEHGQATRLNGWAETPSNSRPMYEVLHTGIPTFKNSITTNFENRNSKEKSVFKQVKDCGKTTGAAAYYWMSELYNASPFNPFEHRIQYDSEGLIDNGFFYNEDDYPDSHLFADAHHILSMKSPEYMLVHSMNIDNAGHKFGCKSKEYKQAANKADIILATFIPKWIQMGYQVVVVSDHGMDEWGIHGGTTFDHRATSMFVISDKIKKGFREEIIGHLDISDFLLYLLGISESQPKFTKIKDGASIINNEQGDSIFL